MEYILLKPTQTFRESVILMLENKVPITNHDYSLEKFENEVILYTISGTKVIALNETAYMVYQLCNGELTVGAMIEMLIDAYPEQEKAIRDDTIAAIETLRDNGVIEFSDE